MKNKGYKIDFLFDGDPGVAQSYSGTYRELHYKMDGVDPKSDFHKVEKFFPIFNNQKVKSVTAEAGSITIKITRL